MHHTPVVGTGAHAQGWHRLVGVALVDEVDVAEDSDDVATLVLQVVEPVDGAMTELEGWRSNYFVVVAVVAVAVDDDRHTVELFGVVNIHVVAVVERSNRVVLLPDKPAGPRSSVDVVVVAAVVAEDVRATLALQMGTVHSCSYCADSDSAQPRVERGHAAVAEVALGTPQCRLRNCPPQR